MTAKPKRHPPLSYKNPVELLFIALPVVVCALTSASQMLMVSTFNGPWFAFHGAMGMITLICLIISGFTLVVALPLTFFKGPKKLAQQSMAIAFWSIFIILGYLALNGIIRSNAFDKLADRMKPLVQAIKQYEAKNQHPPANLEVLVPEYIAAIPKTEMSSYPVCEYKVKPDPNSDVAWQLVVPCADGYYSFDEFLYWPKGNYPTRLNGGRVERRKDWAYVHE